MIFGMVVVVTEGCFTVVGVVSRGVEVLVRPGISLPLRLRLGKLRISVLGSLTTVGIGMGKVV